LKRRFAISRAQVRFTRDVESRGESRIDHVGRRIVGGASGHPAQMAYRGMRYFIAQEGPDSWKWTVELNDFT
jgi:hypothetical protein